MPEAWSDKDERKYRKIQKSAKARGKSAKRAKEIAARTVNKQRRQESRTPNKTSSGTGNPGNSLADRTVTELRNRARQLDIKGRSGMSKAELIRSIRKHG